MSVFGDFQRVWVQRFPDSALPAAWEEDVRANLVKHKLKVRIQSEILCYYRHSYKDRVSFNNDVSKNLC